MRTALEDAGFLYIQLFDHLAVFQFDGSIKFDGSHLWDSAIWAEFKLEMEPPVGVLAEDVDIKKLMLLINYWKRACTLLIDLQIDRLRITDFGLGNIDTPQYFWDGSVQFNGSIQFGG